MPESPVASEIDGAQRPTSGPSVRVRILAAILLVTGLGMMAAGGIAYAVQRERTVAAIDERLAAAVDDVRFVAAEVDPARVAIDGPVLATLTAVIEQVRPGTNETTFAVADGVTTLIPGGEIDFRVDSDVAFLDRVTAETAGGGVVTGTAVLDSRAVRYVAVPIVVAQASDTGLFVMAVDVSARLEPVDQTFSTYAVVAALAFVLIGLVGWFVAGRLLRPIRSLRDAAMRITASNTSERIPVVGRDDVSDLTETVNNMLDRIESGLTGQRRLLDDVGHELKTPLTIVRGHLEVMDVTDVGDVLAARNLAIDELDRMSGLVTDIVTLAEAQRPVPITLVATDLGAFTAGITAKASALSMNRWVTGGSVDGVALVDPHRITQAMLQFAANAVRHGTDARAEIRIGSTTVGQRLQFWVADSGPGVGDDSREMIFERFRRGTQGRGREGSGLGLSIVAAIAAAHDGRAFVTAEAGSGSRFTIEIPYLPAPDVSERTAP